MKRSLSLLLLVVSLAMPSLLRAQVGERRNELAFGFNAGWMMNRMSFTPTIKQSMKSAPTFGATMRYISEKYFTAICGVQLEVNYANAGWKELIEDGSGNTYSRDIHYVPVPMLMQMGWGRERRGLKFLFEAGPQVGFMLGNTTHQGGQQPWDVSLRPNGVVYQYDHEPDHFFDYGITAGLGVELSTAVGHFLLEGRYYYGLADVYDNSKKGFFDRSANSTIVVKLNYLFDVMRTKQPK
jgi:hypothetical protein